MASYLLDTSAWLAHALNEPGADGVLALFEDAEATVSISALSILEAHARFRSIGRPDAFADMLAEYRQLFAHIYPVSEAIALRAVALREGATTRVPAIDTLIAATAAHHSATLVHRDPHLAALPAEAVSQRVLGEVEE